MGIVEKDSIAEQVSRPHPPAFRQFLRVVRFESISIITVFFAMVVTRGYTYLEKVDLILGVPAWRVGYDSLIYAIYGGLPFTFLLTGVGAGTALALAFLGGLVLLEKPAVTKPPEKHYDQNSIRYRLPTALPLLLGAFFVGLFSILLWLVMDFMVKDAQKSAITVAYELIEKCSEATLALTNTDKVTGCIVGETDDMLYIVKRISNENDVIKFSKIMQPKIALASSSEPAELKKPM